MKNLIEKKKRGLLIIIEGVDRAGKSTQLQMLKNYFENTKNEKCVDMRFPDRETKIGKEINDILKNYKSMEVRATHLLFSLNRWEKREEIINYLESGVNLIVDRYAFSGVVYSICNGASPEWCMHPDQGLPRPDLVLQLDVDIEKVKKRENFGDEIYEKEDFQKLVRKEFMRFHNYRYWRIINADQNKQNVHNDILKEIEILIKDYESNENDEFAKNLYPNSIGEDLFMYKDI